jgi:hypothetical protein
MDKHDRPYRQSSEDDVMDYLATGDDTGTRNDMGDLCDVTENHQDVFDIRRGDDGTLGDEWAEELAEMRLRLRSRSRGRCDASSHSSDSGHGHRVPHHDEDYCPAPGRPQPHHRNSNGYNMNLDPNAFQRHEHGLHRTRSAGHALVPIVYVYNDVHQDAALRADSHSPPFAPMPPYVPPPIHPHAPAYAPASPDSRCGLDGDMLQLLLEQDRRPRYCVRSDASLKRNIEQREAWKREEARIKSEMEIKRRRNEEQAMRDGQQQKMPDDTLDAFTRREPLIVREDCREPQQTVIRKDEPNYDFVEKEEVKNEQQSLVRREELSPPELQSENYLYERRIHEVDRDRYRDMRVSHLLSERGIRRRVKERHDRQKDRNLKVANSTNDRNNEYEGQRDRKRSRSDALSARDADCTVSPKNSMLDRRSRSSSSARGRNGSLSSRNGRSSSNAPDQRDYILDLANPERTTSNGAESRRQQKHPATFQCTLCPKRFTRAYNLRSHLRTHTDERPFVCTVCGKAFARQHDRKRHEGLHCGEGKYSEGASIDSLPEKTTSDAGSEEVVADHDLGKHGDAGNDHDGEDCVGHHDNTMGDATAVQALLNRWLNSSASALLLKDDEPAT